MNKFVFLLLFSLFFSNLIQNKKKYRKLNKTEPPQQPAQTPSQNSPPITPELKKEAICKKNLLNSYELWYEWQSPQQKNLLCPAVKKNCCSYKVQLKIFKNWVQSKERENINNTYKNTLLAFQKIFANFKKVKIFANEGNQEGLTTCSKLGLAIKAIDIDDIEKKVIATASKAFKFLYESRKGFYCAICDAEKQALINESAKEFVLSFNFCSKMVSETLGFYLFKYVNFMKLARIYGKFMKNCNFKGKFLPNKNLKHSSKFFKEKEIYNTLVNCKLDIGTPKGLDSCSSFCRRFNPTKYDHFLEGGFNKLEFFNESLNKMIEDRIVEINKEKEKRDLDIGNRRILAEKDKKTEPSKENKPEVKKDAGKKEEPVQKTPLNEFDEFNKQWNYYLINPLSHDFHKGVYYIKTIDLEESILPLDVKSEVDVSEFKARLDTIGINFFNYGKSANFDKKQVDELIKLAGPASAEEKTEN